MLGPLFIAVLQGAFHPSRTGIPIQQEVIVTTRIHGPFEVKLTPFPTPDPVGPWVPGRMAIEKQFRGDLEAVSQGEMMAVRTEIKGSAGYVAMERVSGTLKGKRGTFVLQHSSTMARGEAQQSIQVVPDSGTGELTGLKGAMTIIITDGKHAYDFEYTLPIKPVIPPLTSAPPNPPRR